jgi:chromosome partitioning protein
MKTLAFANQKGGVGKSAILSQFAHYLAKCHYKVLVIDLDHQQNTSTPLLKSGTYSTIGFNASDMMKGHRDEDEILSDLTIVSGDSALSSLERDYNSHNTFVNNINKFINSHSDRFDACLIDTNPNPDIRYASALIVADFIISPVQLNQEALDGITALQTHPKYGVTRIKTALNPKLKFLGILPNMVEMTPFQKDNFAMLARSFSNLLIRIPKRSAIAEAQAEGLFIGDMSKTAARDAWREIKPTFDFILNQIMEP